MTYVILSNFYNFSQLVNTHPLLFYQLLSSHQTFIHFSSSYQTYVIFSPLVIYSLFTLSSHPINSSTVHITQHNSLSCLIVRTLSALIYPSNSPAVFGHRAILLWGGSRHGWGFPHRTNRYVLSASARDVINSIGDADSTRAV